MLTKFTDWGEVISGLHRIIKYTLRDTYRIYAYSTDILTAKASLYVVYNNGSEDKNNDYFNRTCILSSNTVQECLSVAHEYNTKRRFI